MSWDIFVQDIPKGIKSAQEIPDGWMPEGGIAARVEVLRVIREVLPTANLSDPTWIQIDDADCCMEISLHEKERVDSFAFFVRFGDRTPVAIGEILRKLGLRAFDTSAESGLFDSGNGADSQASWQCYRDQVIGDRGGHPPTSNRE
jgi:hypothetical protein